MRKRQKFIVLCKTEFQGLFSNGSYRVSQVEATLNELRKTLGSKYLRYSSDKTSVYYEIMLDDKSVFVLYDYKYYGKESPLFNPDEEITWSISAPNEVDGLKGKLFMEELLGEFRNA